MLKIDQELGGLTLDLVNIASVSKDEKAIADLVQAALSEVKHLKVSRISNSVIAQTNFGHSKRVVIAGHLDTVPANKNFPGKKTDTEVIGLGAVDMKSGVAAALKLARCN